MKITKENLEKYQIYITSKGNIRSKRFHKTFYKKICPQCHCEFLARVRNDRKGQGNSEEFCSQNCHAKFDSKGFGYRGGYKVLFGENYPPRNGKLEHRFIAEQVLGRLLKSNEEVHHINGNPLDNRNCNLLICDKSYHGWLREKMSELYMKEHFA